MREIIGDLSVPMALGFTKSSTHKMLFCFLVSSRNERNFSADQKARKRMNVNTN